MILASPRLLVKRRHGPAIKSSNRTPKTHAWKRFIASTSSKSPNRSRRAGSFRWALSLPQLRKQKRSRKRKKKSSATKLKLNHRENEKAQRIQLCAFFVML